MTLNNYIERRLQRKNSGVYFRKGRWVLHIFFIIVVVMANAWKLAKKQATNDKVGISVVVGPTSEKGKSERTKLDTDVDFTWQTVSLAISKTAPFIIFFYFYCLYLIPYCFKRNRIKKFWILLGVCIVLFPAIEIVTVYILIEFSPFLANRASGGFITLATGTYSSFIGNFMGFTTLLFLMELLEGVRTRKEIKTHEAEISHTALSRIKMQISPGFMTSSLDKIVNLAEHHRSQTPDTVIAFSDLLRYRLYRSKASVVYLDEEFQQLQQLANFHNNVFERQCVTFEYEGTTANAGVPPLALINIAEPLLNFAPEEEGWSFVFYMLVEESELQIAVEYDTSVLLDSAVFSTIKEGLVLMFNQDITFAVEHEPNNYSLRICLPLQRHSNALS